MNKKIELNEEDSMPDLIAISPKKNPIDLTIHPNQVKTDKPISKNDKIELKSKDEMEINDETKEIHDNIESKDTIELNDENDENVEEEKPLPSYYLTNFWLIVDSVLKENKHLFLENELEWIEKIKLLDDSSQRLFIRLISRKKEWFRLILLNYKEITNLEEAIKILEKNELVDVIWKIEKSNLEVGITLLSMKEMRLISSKLHLKMTSSSPNNPRNQMEQLLLGQKNQKTLFGEALIYPILNKMIGICLRIIPSFVTLFDRIKYLFFLNEHQDQTLLLLIDMNKVKFPEYQSEKKYPIFNSRKSLEIYEEAKNVEKIFNSLIQQESHTLSIKIINSCARWLLTIINLEKDPFKILNKTNSITKDWNENQELEFWDEKNELISNLVFQNPNETVEEIEQTIKEKPFLIRFTKGWVFTRILYYGIPILEKLKFQNHAILLLRILLSTQFCQGKRIKWWTRLAINLEHQKRKVFFQKFFFLMFKNKKKE